MTRLFWRNTLRTSSIVLSLFLIATFARSTIHRVPGDFADIQPAINAAIDGDTIRVYSGTYTGPIDINKSLVVIGSWPDTLTTIKAPSDFASNTAYDHELSGYVTGRTIVHVGSTAPITVTFRGFIIDGLRLGPSIDQHVGYSGILAEKCSFTLTGSLVKNILPADSAGSTWEINKRYNGRGVEARGDGSIAVISNNTFQDINRFNILANATDDADLYPPSVFPFATITQNTIIGKGIYNGAQKGVWFNYGAYGTIARNTISSLDFPDGALEPDRASGIVLWECDRNLTGVTTIANNTLTASSSTNNKGIYAWGVGDTIRENVITGFRWGVELHNERHPLVARNTITGGAIGVMVVDEEAGRSDTVTIGGARENKNVISGQISPSAGGRAIALSFRDPADPENLSSPIPVIATYNDFGVYTGSEIRARIFCKGDTTIALDTVFFSPFAVPKPTLSLKAFLQGPFNTGTGEMTKSLNTAGVLATHFGVGKFPANAVDSIKVEVRDSLTSGKSTRIYSVPAWLLTDGTIRSFIETEKSYLELPDSVSGNYYVVMRHRNHLAIMSSGLDSCEGSTAPIPYDFTMSQSSAYGGGSDALKAVGTKFAMFAGNGNGDGSINATDLNAVWRVQNGSINGYYNGDFNLDTYVNATDLNGFWRVNNGTLSQVK